MCLFISSFLVVVYMPMPSQLEAKLLNHLRSFGGSSDLVFVNRIGRPFSANKLRENSPDPLLKTLGIPTGGFHSMRHGAATELLNVLTGNGMNACREGLRRVQLPYPGKPALSDVNNCVRSVSEYGGNSADTANAAAGMSANNQFGFQFSKQLNISLARMGDHNASSLRELC